MKMMKKFSCLILILAMFCSLVPTKNVSAAKTKRYTILVLDASKGVKYSRGGSVVYESSGILKASKEAAKHFVENLYSKESKYDDYIAVGYLGYRNNKNGGIISVDGNAVTYVTKYFTNNKNIIVKKINSIKEASEGGTNMAVAIRGVKKILSRIEGNNKNMILINTGDNCHIEESLESDIGKEYREDGHYTEDVVGNSWRYGNNDIEYEERIPCYYYNNVAYDDATELKQEANVFSIGMFNIYDDAPDDIRDIIALQKLLAKDIATNKNFYFEIEDMDDLDDIQEVIDKASETFSKELFEVKVESDDENLGSVTGGGKYFDGDIAVLEANPEENCAFVGWYDDNDALISTDSTYYFQVYNSMKITGVFIQKYTIDVESDNETQGTVTDGGTFNAGESVTIEAYPNENYHFAGWYDEYDDYVSGENPYTFQAEDFSTLIAKFEHDPIEFKPLVNNSDFGAVSCDKVEFNIGDIVIYRAKPEIGYKFVGWYDEYGNLVSKKNPYRIVVDENNTNIIAHFKWDSNKSDDDTVKEIDKSDLKPIFLEGRVINGKIKLKWSKAGKNTHYRLYKSECNGRKGLEYYNRVCDTSKNTYTIGGLNQKKAYKFYVAGYKKKNGNIKFNRKSFVSHVALPKYKQTNVKKVVVKKSSIKIKVGQKSKIKAKIASENKKKRTVDRKHVSRYRYYSSNKSVATVTKNGLIKGEKKGNCKIYVIAHNGIKKVIKVTIR